MPTVFVKSGFRFFFLQTRAIRDDAVASPDVSIAYNDGFNSRVLNEIVRLVEADRDEIERFWNEFFRQADGGHVR
jgi:hypothetical protein